MAMRQSSDVVVCMTVIAILSNFISVSEASNTLGYNITEERSYPTRLTKSPLLKPLLDSLASQRHAPKVSKTFKAIYDFVVVGAGAAGSVVASRLSELSCLNVLLLEAGKSPPLISDLPAIYGPFFGSDLDWDYVTEPQKYSALGLKDNKLPWPSGKAIGGSTIINAMFSVRGNKMDYDGWERLGALGWNWTSVFPFFNKMEDNKVYGSSDYHGAGGPVTIERSGFEPPVRAAFLDAGEELGLSVVDSNGKDPIGIFDTQLTMRNAQRCSAAKAYLVPAEDRPNLDIVADAFVTKVVVSNGRATGVEFDIRGEKHRVDVYREVILSAGAVNSAQLLMLSGIGPQKHLEEMRIPVVADLPVGKNFQDHLGIPLSFEIDDNFPTFHDRWHEPDFVDQYIADRKGPMASLPGFGAITFLSDDGNKKTVNEVYIGEYRVRSKESKGTLKQEIYDWLYGQRINRTMFSCSVIVSNPKSRGFVKLRSKDPYDPPVINPKYLKDPHDVLDAIKGLKFCRTVANTAAMRRIGAKDVFGDILPADCEPYGHDEDESLICYVRHVSFTMHHPCGTARMGRENDPSTVVGPDLRVKGIDGLRVVDASVMPSITSGNTMVPTMMIAEKAAHSITRDIRCH